jgi:dienelactone hydrolase
MMTFRTAVLSLALAARAAMAQARIEVIPLQSVTLTTQQFLSGDASGKPALLAGELRIPKPGTERLPAVVLVHGSSGIGPAVAGWAHELTGAGFAVFLLDSFSGRGITSTVENQTLLSHLAMMVDAWRALAVLAAHPRIDRNRIAIMGFSKGAVAAVYSAMDRFRKMHRPADVAFAAHIGLYTPCGTSFLEDDKVGKSPIRLFHGIADDWVPIGPCRLYVDRLKKAGADVKLTEYPDAVHAYDNPALAQPVKLPQAQTGRHCRLQEVAGGEIMNAETGKNFDYSDPCMERGTQVAYNAAAHQATVKAVKEFLGTALAQK